MAAQSRSEIIKSKPIGSDLGSFRSSCKLPVDQMNDEDVKNHAGLLFEELQNLPAAKSLPCVAGGGKFRFDLQDLERSISEDGHFDREGFTELLETVLSNESDEIIWIKAYDVVIRFNDFRKSSGAHEQKKKMVSRMYSNWEKMQPYIISEQATIVKEGSQGSVRREIDSDGQEIAVKTIYYGNRKNIDKVIQDFERECGALRSLPHPSIVPFLNFSHDLNMQKAVLRMRWASCKLSESGSADLGDIIHSRLRKDEHIPLPESFLWHILFHLSAALARCHHGIGLDRTRKPARADSGEVLSQLTSYPTSQLLSLAKDNSQVTWITEQIEFSMKTPHYPVVHRDIKPRNVLLSDPPEEISNEQWMLNSDVSLEKDDIFRLYPIVLLGDFGLSAPLEDAHTRAIGTFEYCAPEVPRELSRPGSSKFDWTTKCDIFSLGATLWHLITLQGPPERAGKTDHLPSLPTSYSKRLRRLIVSCCEWEASLRPTAIDILAACIERSYWDETYVSPYGLPIAFDFTTILWKSLQECRQRIIPDNTPLELSLKNSSLIDHGFSLISLGERTGEPLSIIVAGAYFSHHSRPKPKSIFYLPLLRSLHFVGRQDVLELLHSRINSNSTDQVVVSLCGMGGIGKTQIAIQFAHQLKERYAAISIFWVNGSCPSAVQESYYRIAIECGIPASGRFDPITMLQVKIWLESESAGRWLMIVDNVDDRNAFLNPKDTPSIAYMPKCRNGSIIYTTRDPEFAEQVSPSDIVYISAFTELEATAFFSKILSPDLNVGDPQGLAILLNELGHFPLAISNAAAFMKRYDVPVSQYLDYFKNQETTRLALKYETMDDTRDKGWESFSSTRNIYFQILQGSLAAEVLALMSFLDPDTIPVSLLAEEFEDKLLLDEAISALRKMSLISPHNKGEAYAIHRLVQVSIKSSLDSEGSTDHFLTRCLDLLVRVFPEYQDENREKSLSLLPHAVQVLSRHTDSNPPGRSRLLLRVSQWELVLGRLQDAYQHAEEGLSIQLTLLGSMNSDTLRCQAHVARVLWALGRYEEAKRLADETSTAFHAKSPESQDTFASMNIIALVLHSVGEYAEAERIYWEILESKGKAFGEEDPFILAITNSLATLLADQGKYEDAEKILREIGEITERVLGSDNPSTLATINNLALVFNNQGKYQEAKMMHRRILNLSQTSLGKTHPDTIASMNNLANALSSQSEYQEAERIYREVLDLRQLVLGNKHRDTLAGMNNLANALFSQGKCEESERVSREALRLRQSVLRKEHPDTLTNMNNLANALSIQDKYEESERIYREVLELRQAMLGNSHPDTLNSMNNLANALYFLSEYEEAEHMFREVLELRERVIGKDHPDTLTSMNNLANTLVSQGRYEEAEALSREALELIEGALDNKHPDILTNMSDLANPFVQQGKVMDLGTHHNRLILDTINILESTTQAYSKINAEKSLPDILHEAGRGLLLIKEALQGSSNKSRWGSCNLYSLIKGMQDDSGGVLQII